MEHAGRDNISHMLKYTFQSRHPSSPNDFRILRKVYNNKVKRKISEAILIRKQPLFNQAHMKIRNLKNF